MNSMGKQVSDRRRCCKRINASVVAVLLSILLSACSSAPLAATVQPTAAETPVIAESEASADASGTDKSLASGEDVSLTMEGSGFDSPESAVTAYLDGLKDADINRMISAFAVESYVGNYDFTAMLNRIKAYAPSQEIKLPNANEFVTAMNIESRRSRVTNSILQQYASLSNLELDPAQTKVLENEKDVDEFAAKLNENLCAPNLQTLKIIGFIPPESLAELYNSEQNLANIARQSAIYGAEQMVSRVVVFELDGNNYLLCFDAVKYNGNWYVSQFGGNIGAMLGISYQVMGLVPLPDEAHDELNELIIPIE